MRKKLALIMIVTVLLLTWVSPALIAAADEVVDQALDWLKEQQNADGGFSDGFSPDSSLSATTEVVIALAAGGQDAGMVRSADGASPLDYLHQQVSDSQVEGVGTTAKVVLALVAAGVDPTDFAGQDLVGQLEAAFDTDSGAYGGSIFEQALVVLALANAGQVVPEGAVDYLLAHQTADGAWNFLGDTSEQTGDTNTTALVVQAVVAAGRDEGTEQALAYLTSIQNEDGGWPYQNPSDFGTETDANSTALVLEALYALGQATEDWQMGDADPSSALLSLQNASGSFSYQASFPGDNALATIQAIPALMGVTLAKVQSVATSAIPGEAVTTTPPTTMPEAGGSAGVSVASILGTMIAGLSLVAVGLRLKRMRKPAAQ
jgi:prenyltransferase beta subunit